MSKITNVRSTTAIVKILNGDVLISQDIASGAEGVIILAEPIPTQVLYSNGAVAFSGDLVIDKPFIIQTAIFPPFEPEMEDIIAYAEANDIPLPSALDLAKQNQFIALQKELIGGRSIWSISDVMYWFQGSGTLDWKAINMKNPGTHNITWFGGMINTQVGVESNGVNGVGLTNYNPFINGVNYQLLNASRRAYVYKTPTDNVRFIDSADNVGNQQFFMVRNTNIHRINGIQSSTVNMDGVGYKAIIRDNETQDKLINETTKTVRSNEAVNVHDGIQAIFGRVTFSPIASDAGLTYYSIGAALTEAEANKERLNILSSL